MKLESQESQESQESRKVGKHNKFEKSVKTKQPFFFRTFGLTDFPDSHLSFKSLIIPSIMPSSRAFTFSNSAALPNWVCTLK